MRAAVLLLAACVGTYLAGALGILAVMRAFERPLHAWYWSHWNRPIRSKA